MFSFRACRRGKKLVARVKKRGGRTTMNSANSSGHPCLRVASVGSSQGTHPSRVGNPLSERPWPGPGGEGKHMGATPEEIDERRAVLDKLGFDMAPEGHQSLDEQEDGEGGFDLLCEALEVTGDGVGPRVSSVA